MKHGLHFKFEFLFVMLVLCISSGAAISADMEVLGNQVILSGEIVGGDAERFQQFTEVLPAGTIVRLQSPGGSLIEGIAIGYQVRERQFLTYAHYGQCASACGLVWLAGVERWTNPNASVGFHQAYTGAVGSTQSSGPGNALVGAYMNELGYSAGAILFATDANPDELAWLNSAVAHRVGIDFLEGTPSSRQTKSVQEGAPLQTSIEDMLHHADQLRHDGQYNESADLYRRLAEQGIAYAQMKLGSYYQIGLGVLQDDTEAAKWYGLAAGQGEPQGQMSYAYRFFTGKGVPRNKELGKFWLTKAAEQGYAPAQVDLARNYRSDRDYDNSVFWYRSAAIQGDPDGQAGLSYLYKQGWGVAKDPTMQLMWSDIAVSNRTDGADTTISRERLARGMTPSQVTEAERRRRLCVHSNYQNCEFSPFALSITGTMILNNDISEFEQYVQSAVVLIQRHFERSGSDALINAQGSINQISTFDLATDGGWGPNTAEAFLRVFIYYTNTEGIMSGGAIYGLDHVPIFLEWLAEAADANAALLDDKEAIVEQEGSRPLTFTSDAVQWTHEGPFYAENDEMCLVRHSQKITFLIRKSVDRLEIGFLDLARSVLSDVNSPRPSVNMRVDEIYNYYSAGNIFNGSSNSKTVSILASTIDDHFIDALETGTFLYVAIADEAMSSDYDVIYSLAGSRAALKQLYICRSKLFR